MNPILQIEPSLPSGATPGPLLTEEQLVVVLWPISQGRPTSRWFRQVREAGGIPFVKIRGKVFYEADQVRAALVRLYGNNSNLPTA